MENEDLELGYYGLALKRRWWLVALVVAATLFVAWTILPEARTTYTSETTVLVQPLSLDVVEGLDRNQSVNEATEVGIAQSDAVANRSLQRIQRDDPDFDMSIDDFKDRLDVVAEDDSQLITFSFDANDAAAAELAAAAVADEYLGFKEITARLARDRRLANYQASIESVSEQLTDALSRIAATEEDSAERLLAESDAAQLQRTRSDLQATANRLETADLTVGDLIGSATPAEAVSAGISRPIGLLLAGVVGLMAGLGLALGLDRVDRGVRDSDDVELELQVPVVGDIPKIGEEAPELITAVRAETDGANAFRRLGIAVLAGQKGPLHSVLLTSAHDKEGRTTAAVNTAIALSQSGRDVYLVSADRRNPDIDRLFGLAFLPGLDQFFRSPGTVADAEELMHNAPVRLGMRVIPSGASGGFPQPLSAAGIASMLQVATAEGAVVVFDAPPALDHADGLSIASLADATYVVVGRGRSRRQDLADLRMQLRNVDARVSGAVRNHVARWNVRSGAPLAAAADHESIESRIDTRPAEPSRPVASSERS